MSLAIPTWNNSEAVGVCRHQGPCRTLQPYEHSGLKLIVGLAAGSGTERGFGARKGVDMRWEPNNSHWSLESNSRIERRNLQAAKLMMLALTGVVTLVAACAGGTSGINPPPPQRAPEWFFVSNASGTVSGFSAASGRLEAIPGSAAQFPLTVPSLLTSFAVDPGGTFLAGITGSLQAPSTFQIANIGSGGTVTIAPLTTKVTNPGGMAISAQGAIAITDTVDSTVQLMFYQSNLLFQAGSAATGAFPQDLVFSADGRTLYVGNDGDGTVSVFSVAGNGTLQLVQTAKFVAPGGQAVALVRVRLSAAGRKFAATTLDGLLFLADVSVVDQTLSNIQGIRVANLANLEEVVFDPSGQNVYTADQDNGGIYGFSLNGGNVTALRGSPFSTGALPGGPTGMAFNSAGDRLYVVMGAQSAVLTYSRDTNTGLLTATGDTVSSGGFLAGRIVRVPSH